MTIDLACIVGTDAEAERSAVLKTQAQSRTYCGFAILTAVLAALISSMMLAASRAADEDVPKADLWKQRPHVMDVLTGKSEVDDLFKRYFDEYFFQQFTRPTGRTYSLDDLPKLRRDLRNYFLSCKSAGCLRMAVRRNA